MRNCEARKAFYCHLKDHLVMLSVIILREEKGWADIDSLMQTLSQRLDLITPGSLSTS